MPFLIGIEEPNSDKNIGTLWRSAWQRFFDPKHPDYISIVRIDLNMINQRRVEFEQLLAAYLAHDDVAPHHDDPSHAGDDPDQCHAGP